MNRSTAAVAIVAGRSWSNPPGWIPEFFADLQSPWQRGTNENTNGLLRQYFPKGTDISRWTADDIAAIAATINSRPRKVLGWRTPAEALDELLRCEPQAGVATTT